MRSVAPVNARGWRIWALGVKAVVTSTESLVVRSRISQLVAAASASAALRPPPGVDGSVTGYVVGTNTVP